MKPIVTLVFVIVLGVVAQVDDVRRDYRTRAGKQSTGLQSESLEGSSWRLLAYHDGDGMMTDALPDVAVDLAFHEDGWLDGNSGCNLFSGNYTVEENRMSISGLGTTAMACDSFEVMEQEAQLMAALQAVATFAVTGGQLQLADLSGETLLTLVATAPAIVEWIEPLSLIGANWWAVNVNNGCGGFPAPRAGGDITAIFSATGELTGSAGCNQYRTSYTLDGENMTIQPPASTRQVCRIEGVMELESTYLSLLPQVATYTINGQYLELWTEGGVLVVRYRAEPLDHVVVPAGSSEAGH